MEAVLMRKFDGTEAVMDQAAAEAIQVPEDDVLITARQEPFYQLCEQEQAIDAEVPTGTKATEVAGVEEQIRSRPLDSVQQKVVEATTEALRARGLQGCLGLDTRLPDDAYQELGMIYSVTPVMRWGSLETGNNTFASRGIAYIEAVNQVATANGVQTIARVRYSANSSATGYYPSTGWIELASNNVSPFAHVDTIAGGTAAITANNNGWFVCGSTNTIRVLYQWADGEYQGAFTYPPQKTPAERLKEILESRLTPYVIAPRTPVPETADIREQRARDTLRRVLGELKFRDFLRKGFVSVRAKSGLIYQIFPRHGITAVFDRAEMVERLCVVLSGDFPPTDSLIMRYLLILNNESQFRNLAVKHDVNYIKTKPLRHYPNNPFGGYKKLPLKPDQRDLTEIFREMKKVPA